MQAPMTIKQYVSQMRKIPGGRFTMGRTYEMKNRLEFYQSEVPAHPVDISSFKIGATPVTVGMWREYVRANKRIAMPKAPNWGWIDDHPMVNVEWSDILGDDGRGGYCSWASKVCGLRLTLTSEAQWEYAAKGGQQGLKYPWGENFDSTLLHWAGSGAKGTDSVVRNNQIYCNNYGLTDMAGNVWEWCLDNWRPFESQKRDRLGYPLVLANPKVIDPGPSSVFEKVLKGGSWWPYDENLFRCAVRWRTDTVSTIDGTGFRLAAA